METIVMLAVTALMMVYLLLRTTVSGEILR